MAKTYYDFVLSAQNYWKRTPNLSPDIKADMIALSNILLHKIIDNNHSIEGVTLSYPEDCANYAAFGRVGFGLSAFIYAKKGGGLIMEQFGQCHDEISVE